MLLALALLACHKDEPADTVLTDGTIHQDVTTTTSAMAIRDGVIVAVGDDAAGLVGPDTETVDLGGAHAYAGFEDAHTHLLAGNFAMQRLLLIGTPSMEAMTSSVKDYAEAHPEEPWIVGYGWFNENIPDPDGRPLTEAVPDRPVLLVSDSGHAAIVNQKALDLAGITKDTPDPVGGTIARDPKTGEPTGYLLEGAESLVADVVLDAYDDATLSGGLAERMDDWSANGITGVHEILAVPGFDIGRPWIYADMETAGTLPMRVTWFAPVFSMADLDTAADDRDSYQGSLVRFGGAKVWVDGSMGTAEAWVSQPYVDRPEDYGSHYWEPAQLVDIVRKAEELGIPLKMHVNGDAAITAALDALEQVADENGGLTQQHCLEHVCLINEADRARMAELGIVASVQPTHWVASRLGNVAEDLGEERFDGAYDYRDLEDAGVTVAMGTDWPVWPSEQPLLVTWNAATSQVDNGHGMTLAEALRGYTEGTAHALGREDELGRLDVGDLADFVVLKDDPQAMDIDDVPDDVVQQVWVAGVRRH